MTEGQDDNPSESKFGNFLDSVDSFSKKIESSIIGRNTNSEVIEDPIETVENPIEDKLKLEGQLKEDGFAQEKASEVMDFLERLGSKISLSLKKNISQSSIYYTCNNYFPIRSMDSLFI